VSLSSRAVATGSGGFSKLSTALTPVVFNYPGRGASFQQVHNYNLFRRRSLMTKENGCVPFSGDVSSKNRIYFR
jgi:hypothetical protein